MVIYFLLIISWFIIWNKYHNGRDKEIKFMYIMSIVLLFLMMGLRADSIGPDTQRYCFRYVMEANRTWREILYAPFSLGDSNYGFLTFNKLIGMVFPYFYPIYLLAVSGIISYALYRFLKEFSVHCFFSLIMLIALGFVFFFMSGIKQTLAIAFVLLSFIELYNDNKIQYLILVLVAALFHNTALIALLALPVYKLKIKRLYFLIVPLMVVFTLSFQSVISSTLQMLVSEGKYSVYGNDYVATGNLTGLYIQVVIIAVTLLLTGEKIKFDHRLQFFVSLYSIGIFFQALTPVVAEFFRISMYFSITGCVMLPYAVENSRIKQKHGVSAALIIFLCAYFVISSYGNTSMIPYKFFWQ